MSAQDEAKSRDQRSRRSDVMEGPSANDDASGSLQPSRDIARRGSTHSIAAMRSAKRGRLAGTAMEQISRSSVIDTDSSVVGFHPSRLQHSPTSTLPAHQLRAQQEALYQSNSYLPLQSNLSSSWYLPDTNPEIQPTINTQSSNRPITTPSPSLPSSYQSSVQPTDNTFLSPSVLFRAPLSPPNTSAIEGINYGHPYFQTSQLDNPTEQNNAPTGFGSNRRIWLPPSQVNSTGQQYSSHSGNLPSQLPALSEQQRNSNYPPPQSLQYPYTSGGVPGSSSSSSGQYDNTTMSSLGASIEDSSSSQGAYEASQQRSQQSMQIAAQQFQQSQQQYHPNTAYNQAMGARSDANLPAPYTLHRLHPGHRSDMSDPDSLSASSSSDWNSVPNLRLQQLRGGQGDSSFLSTTPSDQSSIRTGGKKHQSRARLQTHLRQLQAEMAELKQRVRAAEDLYRESSPIAGPSSASEMSSTNRLTDTSSFKKKSNTGNDEMNMRDSKLDSGGNLSRSIGGGDATMEGLSSIYSSSFPQSLNMSSMTSNPTEAKRSHPYSTAMPSRSSAASSSSSSAMNTVLGRRGTWRSGEGGRVLVFNAGGTGDYEYTARGSTSRSGQGTSTKAESDEKMEAGDVDADEDLEEGEGESISKMEDETRNDAGGSGQTGVNDESNQRYQCLVSGCFKTFTTSGHARRHSRTHLGHKLFVCPHDGCGSTFTRRDNCRQHQRARHRSTLPVYELTETDTLEHLILDRQQEEQERERQHQQQMHVLHNMAGGSSSVGAPEPR